MNSLKFSLKVNIIKNPIAKNRLFLKTWFSIYFLALSIVVFGQGNSSMKGTYKPSHNAHFGSGKPGYSDSINAGYIVKDTLKGSPIREYNFDQSGILVNVVYSSPGVKGRIIWGGLVAYDKVWVTGANNATRLTLDRSFTVAGKQIEAGSYAFFTIPSANSWTIILNKNYKQHLADDYTDTDDIVRITVMPEKNTKQVQRLTYEVKRVNRKSKDIFLIMSWENMVVKLPISF